MAPGVARGVTKSLLGFEGGVFGRGERGPFWAGAKIRGAFFGHGCCRSGSEGMEGGALGVHADLGFPLCHDLSHRNAVHELDLVLQLLCDTEAHHQLRRDDAARAGRIGDRLGSEHRA